MFTWTLNQKHKEWNVTGMFSINQLKWVQINQFWNIIVLTDIQMVWITIKNVQKWPSLLYQAICVARPIWLGLRYCCSIIITSHQKDKCPCKLTKQTYSRLNHCEQEITCSLIYPGQQQIKHHFLGCKQQHFRVFQGKNHAMKIRMVILEKIMAAKAKCTLRW